MPALDLGARIARGRRSPRSGAWFGLLVGAGIGYLGYKAYYKRDEYCREADMVGCEVLIPGFVLGGAGLGFITGYVVEGTLAPPDEPVAARDTLPG
jgi:hypothetical protein